MTFVTHNDIHSAEAPANTDHVLLVSQLRITLSKPRKASGQPRPIDVARLSMDSTLQERYSVVIQNRFDQLGDLPEDVDDCWNSVSSTIRNTAGEVIGTRKKIRKPWLSADNFAIIEEKARAKARKDYPERKRLQGVFKAKKPRPIVRLT